MSQERVSVYYDKLGEEHRLRGVMLKPPHVAREDGYMGIERSDGRVTWIPWERIIRWETERQVF